jgi:sphingomyelin phosphodiesterase
VARRISAYDERRSRSDIHFDPLYQVGSQENCDAPLCCRGGAGNASRWGSPRCDLTEDMFSAWIAHVSQVDVDAILVTGDLTPHDIMQENKPEQMQRLRRLATIMQNSTIKVPIFFAVGNHDTWACDQFSLHAIDQYHHDNFTWLLDGLASSWALPASAKQTLRTGGYYAVPIVPGLKLISMTTFWWDNFNFYLWFNDDLGAPFIAWLAAELQQSEASGEKVVLIGHIPPNMGVEERPSSVLKRFVSVIARYNASIVANLYGHTHYDEFQLLSNAQQVPFGMAYIAPSLTTFVHINPSYRIYEMDAKTFEVLDYIQVSGFMDERRSHNRCACSVSCIVE